MGQQDQQKWGSKTCRYRKYVCSNCHLHGRTACTRNALAEESLLGAVVRVIQKDFAGAENLSKLRAKIRAVRQARERGDTDRAAQTRARIEELGRQIDQGNANLALIPADRIPGVVDKLRQHEHMAIIRDVVGGKPLLCVIAYPGGVSGHCFDDDESEGVLLALVELFSRGVVIGVE